MQTKNIDNLHEQKRIVEGLRELVFRFLEAQQPTKGDYLDNQVVLSKENSQHIVAILRKIDSISYNLNEIINQ